MDSSVSLPTSHETLAGTLRALRQAVNLTQEELAEAAGLSTRLISDLERGIIQRPRRDTIQMLADGLALPDDERQRFTEVARGRAGAVSAMTASATPPAPDNLPAPPNRLIGREVELAGVVAMLQDDAIRLVTLTGPGGVGKTRLSLAAAAALRPRFGDGVWFVPLESEEDEHGLLRGIAATLGIDDGSLRGVAAAIGGTRLLLVLDNAESVIAAAPAVGDLLARCPRLTILASSREPLRLRAEHEWPLRPLTIPEERAPPDREGLSRFGAVALFRERVDAVRPGHSWSDDDIRAATEIARRLDGLPLALELAAAWCRLLAPVDLLARLEPTLPALARGARDLPARQRTMRDCIAWSHDRLEPDERSAFRRLAIFPGGFTLAAAAPLFGAGGWGLGAGDDGGSSGLVSGDKDEITGTGAPIHSSFPPVPSPQPLAPYVLDLVAALSEKSLLVAGGEGRFRMLEPIREFGLERLRAAGEYDAAQTALLAFAGDLAARASDGLRGPEQARWLQKVSAEHANIRAGLAFASHRGDFDAVFTIVPLLWRYWTGRNRREEGSAWLEPVRVDSIAAAPAARALALYRLGTFAIDRGDYDDAETLLARSLAIYRARDDARGTADALNALGMVAADREQFHAARGLFEESLTLRRTLDDRRAIALSLYNVANLARDEGDLASATALYAEAITSWRALGDRSTEAYVRVAAAVAARQHERPNDAIAGASSAVELFTELDDRGGRHAALTELGRSLAVDGQATAAAETFRTVLRELDAAASEPEMAHNWLEAIEGLALLELAAGRRGRAATLLSCAAAHRQTFGVPYSSPADRDALTVTIATTRLADEPGWQFGQSWTRADAFTDLLSDESDRATP